MSIENRLLSKVLNENCWVELSKANIKEESFIMQGKAYSFINKYRQTYGELPPVETVVAECADFEYVGEVPDNISYLAKSIKDATAKRVMFEMLQNEASDIYNNSKGIDGLKIMADKFNHALEVLGTENGLGTNFATTGAERLQNYLDRKENRTGRFIPTNFRTLNDWLGGGFELGDYILFHAYPNRGKSWVASDFGVSAWNNGFGVLHYSPELSKEQQMDRLDTLNGHFNNMALKLGTLDNEGQYENYLKNFNEDMDTPYIVKTMDDIENGLTVELIEADLQANPDIKMVIIDGFNLMTHKGSKNGSNRDSMSTTSRKLRQIFGKYKVAGIVVHQTPTSAEKENNNKDEAGNRIVSPPELHQYSETVAVIQDACTVLTFDQADGVGAIKLVKARTPNVGKQVELQTDFNMGFIREVTACDYF